jgi:lipoic acid synthetase
MTALAPRKPSWIRLTVPSGDGWREVRAVLEKYDLHTVCDGALCPNKGECWGRKTAAFLLLGDICTRSCAFCAVPSALRGRPLQDGEGEAVARAVEELGLAYVTLTSVDRDDLPGRGALQFAGAVTCLKKRIPSVGVEVLIPDFTGPELEPLAAAAPDVAAHNVETVRSLQRVRDRRASFDKSLDTLKQAKALGIGITKSSLLLGLGEKRDEVLAVMDELRAAGVDRLVMGQYLQPSKRQIPVAEYLHPDVFASYAEEARRRGFSRVVAGPFARTSYHADHD